jgi:hypothetical protein
MDYENMRRMGGTGTGGRNSQAAARRTRRAEKNRKLINYQIDSKSKCNRTQDGTGQDNI